MQAPGASRMKNTFCTGTTGYGFDSKSWEVSTSSRALTCGKSERTKFAGHLGHAAQVKTTPRVACSCAANFGGRLTNPYSRDERSDAPDIYHGRYILNGNTYAVTLPKLLRNKLGLVRGDWFLIMEVGEALVMVKVRPRDVLRGANIDMLKIREAIGAASAK